MDAYSGDSVKTRSQVIKLWQYGELLFWDNPPAGFREFITYSANPKRPTVHAFYLPSGADPYKDSLQTLFNKGAIESTRWYAPPGDPGDDALDPDDQFEASDPTYTRDPDHPLPKGYRWITVRGVQAKLSEYRTDCRSTTNCDREWQSGANIDRRKILATRKEGAGLVQWAIQGHWNARTVEEQIQITESLKAFNR